ncbi:hypothetical protein [Sulfolobus sp. S-194]|uniref:hypothetical protein n=1 Tax=Sulfolobus sp. S-194 TaxID=2512240 RepID=UPI00256FEE02|nr:hypothetical protein [Sulfolobus sp. S-194]
MIHGFNPREVTINDAIAVISKAVRDPGFRNLFFMLLQKEFGDYLKQTSTSYLVTEEDVKLFEKMIVSSLSYLYFYIKIRRTITLS